jgi:TetR/AcrR family transcriptional regulator, transcriptional repressor of aconitase
MRSKTDRKDEVPKGRQRGRPIGDRDAKIAELLRAAREVIAREGCVAASIRKVAKHAGCSTGAITYYFADRNDLLARVVEDLFDDFDRWLAPEDGLAGIRAMSEYQLLRRGAPNDQQIARQVWLQLLVHAGTDAKLAAVIERLYGRFRERLTALIAQAQQAGTIRRDFSADLLADHISAVADGLMMVRSVERKRFERRHVQNLIDMTMAMLQPAKDAAR